tara:strand:+ start:87 stop:323 length:237 start_codon:yes stop_codon:yes gene_type:complete
MFWRRIFKKGYKIKMPKTTTTKTTKIGTPAPAGLQVDHVADMIDRALREHLQAQARELEGHLTDIDRRLNFLEGKGRP